MARRYQPKYCEENIWWLAASDETGLPVEAMRVLFISSETQSCLLFGQRELDPILWDYHVILWGRRKDGAVIWDLDTRLDVPCDATEYLLASFRHEVEPVGEHARVAEALGLLATQRALAEGKPNRKLEFSPSFLALEASDYVNGFSSNRQHMVGVDGELYAPAPSWPCIEKGDLHLGELMRLQGPGRLHDLQSLLACAAENRLP